MAFFYSSTLLLFLSSLLFLCFTRTQQSRAPHGLAFENPIAFPPSAFEFFHPNSPAPALSMLPKESSKARADPVRETVLWSAAPRRSNGRAGAGGLAAIVIALVLVVLAALAASYVVVRRRANTRKAHCIVHEPDA